MRRQNDLSTLQIHEALATLQEQLLSQQAVIDSMQLAANSERARYNKLGKPIGGTFIFAGIILMLFGACFHLALNDLTEIPQAAFGSSLSNLVWLEGCSYQLEDQSSFLLYSLARQSSFLLRLGLADTFYRIIVAAFAAILVIHPAH